MVRTGEQSCGAAHEDSGVPAAMQSIGSACVGSADNIAFVTGTG